MTDTVTDPLTDPDRSPVYIVGRRHSGTTFLDVALGSAEDIRSLGEIVTGLHNGEREVLGSGESLATSPFWSDARRLHRERTGRDLLEDGEWLYRKSNIKHFFSALFADVREHPRLVALPGTQRRADGHPARGRRGAAHPRLEQGVHPRTDVPQGLRARARDPHGQEPGRHRRLALLPHPRQEHAGRLHEDALQARPLPVPGPDGDGRGVVDGGHGGRGVDEAPLPRAVVLDVSYERLCNDPASEFRRIAAFLGTDLEEVVGRIERGEPLAASDTVGGNELKLAGSFTFVPNAEGRRHLPALYRWGIHLCAAPGYLLRRFVVRFD